jgi:lipoprotein-anchoring transpeptidase ErfK/SrfK
VPAADLVCMRAFLVVLALALVATASAVARPSARPAQAFFAATPRAESVVLRRAPGGAALATVRARTEYGSLQTVGVARTRGSWVGVISTALPNGVLGWVPRKDLSLRPVAWSISISLSARRLVLSHDGVVVRRVPVGIGSAGSPTPPGRYVVTDHIDPAAYGAAGYGCCILALSGHQPHPPAGWSRDRDWRLAIHGGAPGAVSAGCVHADEATLRYLMRMTPLGTPVTVSA